MIVANIRRYAAITKGDDSESLMKMDAKETATIATAIAA
jgi:hypothetical protein